MSAIVLRMNSIKRICLLIPVLLIVFVNTASAQTYKGISIPDYGWTIGGANSLVNYNMNDPRWAKQPWGGISGEPTMDSSACGATSLAMAGATLNNNLGITPMQVAHNWVRVIHNGTVSWYSHGHYDYISSAAKSMNLRVRNVGRNLKAARFVVQHGGLAIVLMSPGWFTHNGHYVILRAATKNGFYFADPDGVGEFGNNNEIHSFSAKFLLAHGVLTSIWVMQSKKNHRPL
jgi:hypothetical protein